MSDASQCCLGLDVGGTKIAAGLVCLPEGQILARKTIATQPGRGGRAVLDDVVHLAGELAKEATARGSSVAAVGLGVCELVDRRGRIVSANCLAWMNEPVVERCAAIAPTRIEADVRAAARAEAMFGAGRDYGNF